MCLSLALTAVRYNAAIANYVEAVKLTKSEDGARSLTNGAVVRDKLTGKEFPIKAKCVINATGPFTDNVRLMDDDKQKSICQPSSGVHIILPGYYRLNFDMVFMFLFYYIYINIFTFIFICYFFFKCFHSPSKMGLLDPSTSDGRVIFFLPWMNFSLAGTTDTECPITDKPSPSESEVTFILKEISNYLSSDIKGLSKTSFKSFIIIIIVLISYFI